MNGMSTTVGAGTGSVTTARTYDWDRLLARRTSGIHAWTKVDVNYIFTTPGVIYFGDGAPSRTMMPIHELRQAHANAWEEAADILSYGESLGHQPLREVIAERMAMRGSSVNPDTVLVTNGSQQGLDLIGRVLLDEGDVVVVEGPTYFGALQAFDAYGVQYRVADVDEQGLIPEALEAAFRMEPTPKVLYTIPTFQNPTGSTLAEERRQQVINLAREYGVIIVEDDPYGEMYFGDEGSAPLRALDDHVVYLGTFSKTLAPALRMGWMAVPERLFQALAHSKEAIDIMSDRFQQRAVTQVAQSGALDTRLDDARAYYRGRRDHLLAALQRECGEWLTWTQPQGGFFLWASVPEGRTSEELLDVALQHKVGFLPGSCFFPDPQPHRGFRLAYPTMDDATIDTGMQRLGAALREVFG